MSKTMTMVNVLFLLLRLLLSDDDYGDTTDGGYGDGGDTGAECGEGGDTVDGTATTDDDAYTDEDAFTRIARERDL